MSTNTKFLLRADTSTNLKANPNVVLGLGEPIVETDTHQMKVGDGNTSLANLPYVGSYILPAPIIDFANCTATSDINHIVTSVTVAWLAVPGATSYKVFYTNNSQHVTTSSIENDIPHKSGTTPLFNQGDSGEISGNQLHTTTYFDSARLNAATRMGAYVFAYKGSKRSAFPPVMLNVVAVDSLDLTSKNIYLDRTRKTYWFDYIDIMDSNNIINIIESTALFVDSSSPYKEAPDNINYYTQLSSKAYT